MLVAMEPRSSARKSSTASPSTHTITVSTDPAISSLLPLAMVIQRAARSPAATSISAAARNRSLQVGLRDDIAELLTHIPIPSWRRNHVYTLGIEEEFAIVDPQ